MGKTIRIFSVLVLILAVEESAAAQASGAKSTVPMLEHVLETEASSIVDQLLQSTIGVENLFWTATERDAVSTEIQNAVVFLRRLGSQSAFAALSQLKQGKTEAAEQVFLQIAAAKLSEGVSGRADASEAYANLGAILYLGDQGESLDAYVRATEIDPNNVDALKSLGNLQRKRGSLNDAVQSYQRVLEISEVDGNERQQALALANLGQTALVRDDIDTAEGFYERALTLNERIGHQEGISDALRRLGTVAYRRTSLKSAEKLFNQALNLDEGLSRQEGIANNLSDLGVVAHFRGDPDKSDSYLKRALKIYTEIDHREGVARNMVVQGHIAMRQRDIETADVFLFHGLDLYDAIGHKLGMADTSVIIANIARYRSDFETALLFYDRALTTNRQLGRNSKVVKIVAALSIVVPKLAVIAESSKDLTRAVELWTRARELNLELGNSDDAATNQRWIDALNEEIADERTVWTATPIERRSIPR